MINPLKFPNNLILLYNKTEQEEKRKKSLLLYYCFEVFVLPATCKIIILIRTTETNKDLLIYNLLSHSTIVIMPIIDYF
jgi:hypothetical protein